MKQLPTDLGPAIELLEHQANSFEGLVRAGVDTQSYLRLTLSAASYRHAIEVLKREQERKE